MCRKSDNRVVNICESKEWKNCKAKNCRQRKDDGVREEGGDFHAGYRRERPHFNRGG